jgi:hypothetical protein
MGNGTVIVPIALLQQEREAQSYFDLPGMARYTSSKSRAILASCNISILLSRYVRVKNIKLENGVDSPANGRRQTTVETEGNRTKPTIRTVAICPGQEPRFSYHGTGSS